MITLQTEGREFRLGDTLRYSGRVASFGDIREAISMPGRRPAAGSATATLDNGDGELTRLFSDGRLLGETVDIYRGADLLFTGVLDRVTDGAQIDLNIEAAGLHRLYEPVPLARSTRWAQYRDDRPLPLIYGEATVEAVPYDAERLQHVAADGAVAGPRPAGDVTRDGVPYDDYIAGTVIDSDDQSVLMVTLGAPLVEGEQLAVTVRGETDNGAVIDNAGDIVAHFMTERVGRAVAGLARFRRETAGTVLGGAIVDAERTVQGQLDEIIGSVAGAWSSGLPGFARLYPAARGVGEPIRYTYTPAVTEGMRAEQNVDEVYTVLQIRYAYDWAAAEPAGTVRLIAPAAVSRFGERVLALDWPFAKAAVDVIRNGTRLLQHLARPRAEASFAAAADETALLRLGDWLNISDDRTVATGRDLFVVELSTQPYTGRQAVTCEAPLGPAPAVIVDAVRQRIDGLLLSPATVQAEADIAVFTLLDPDNDDAPLAGALVRLDTGETRRTNNAGVVQFDGVEPGARHIVVTLPDRSPVRYDWVQGA